jgi:hypothetical protein
MDFLFVKKIENINVPIYFTENYLKIMADNDKSEYKILKIILKNSSEIYLTFINLCCYNKYLSFTKYNILSHYLKYYIKLFQ